MRFYRMAGENQIEGKLKKYCAVVTMKEEKSSFVVLYYFYPRRGGEGQGLLTGTINMSPQCRAFTRALQTENLFTGPVWSGASNDWCIMHL